jgi:signal transduction histidine kinase
VNSSTANAPRLPRPGITLALLLAAAMVMLAGGAWLARREVERRIPADRALLRESAAGLQAELTRLDQLYLGHLQRLGTLAEEQAHAELRAAAEKVEGLRLFSIMQRKYARGASVKLPGVGAPPEPEFVGGDRRPLSPFSLAVPREAIFGADEKAPLPGAAEGWTGRAGDPWLGWWRRLDDQRAAVFVIRGSDVRAAMDRQLSEMLRTLWAPVRAAGGLDRVEGPGAKALAGLTSAPDRAPDFFVPLASRLGTWQIVSWDRREMATVSHFPTLIISGTLAIGLALLGWVVAAAQRRALREVTARVSFVNRVSHELGAPLTNISLYLDLARDALAEGDPEGSARRLAVATEETGRLGRLVANVLTFARGERGQFTLQPVPCRPAEIVAGVLAQFSPALARRDIVVETDIDAGAVALLDPDALAQITANLVSNVEKYATSGAWMRLSLATASGEIVLRVADRGPGIPDSEAARIFLPFERLDSRLTEGVSGTGLGLAIARDLASRMGGSVELEHTVSGTGCIFSVRLPHVVPGTGIAAAITGHQQAIPAT